MAQEPPAGHAAACQSVGLPLTSNVMSLAFASVTFGSNFLVTGAKP